MRHLTDDERAKMSQGHCPDCDHKGFVLGPRGGAAINITCGNDACASRFNVTTLGSEIVMGERIVEH